VDPLSLGEALKHFYHGDKIKSGFARYDLAHTIFPRLYKLILYGYKPGTLLKQRGFESASPGRCARCLIFYLWHTRC